MNQGEISVPFLNKAILLELLNTYTGEDLVEKKPDNTPKLWKWFTSALDAGKSAVGINTNSPAWYDKLRKHIIKATDENNLNAWAELIVDAGKAGFQTHSSSVFSSKLCCTAFALRSYILNKVYLMLESIPYRRLRILKEDEDCTSNFDNQTLMLQKKGEKNLIVYWGHNDKVVNHIFKLSEVKHILKKLNNEKEYKEPNCEVIYDILFKLFCSQNSEKNGFLTSDQILALQIRDSLNNKIDEQKKFIEDAKKNIERNKYKPTLEFKNLETIKEIEKYEKNSVENIKIRQRNLCYLNAYNLLKQNDYQVSTNQPKRLLALIRELFPNFDFYDFSSMQLNAETTENMNKDLPLFLQPNYDSIYLRSKIKNPKKETYTDDRVVNTFEDDVIKNSASNKPRPDRVMTIIETPSIQSVPNRTSVPTLTPFDDDLDNQNEDSKTQPEPTQQQKDDSASADIDEAKYPIDAEPKFSLWSNSGKNITSAIKPEKQNNNEDQPPNLQDQVDDHYFEEQTFTDEIMPKHEQLKLK